MNQHHSNNPFDPGYYNEIELRKIGFKSVGSNVLIAKNNTIIGPENIQIGNNVRIDGFCSFIVPGDGSLILGSNIHIGGYCFLSAHNGIKIDDLSTLSQGVKIYTRNDDYSGQFLTNPTVPEIYRGVSYGPVHLLRHSVIGSNSIILPDIIIGIGVSVGAQSLVKSNLDNWGVYAGSPTKKIKERSKQLLTLEQSYLDTLNN